MKQRNHHFRLATILSICLALSCLTHATTVFAEEEQEPAPMNTTAVSAGNAPVSLQQPDSIDTLKLPKIDIATEDVNGRSFKYSIQVSMTKYFDAYIAPLVDFSGSTIGKWKSGQANNFTVTLPADMFDENLIVDWQHATVNTGPMEIKTRNAQEGIILQGKANSGNFMASTFSLFIRVPVTLPETSYGQAAEKGAVSLSGKAVAARVDDASLPPLEFAVNHNIEVIDGNNMKRTLQITDEQGNVPPFEGTSWRLSEGTYTVSGTAQDYEYIQVNGDVVLNLDGATIHHTTTDIEQYAPAISIESGNVKMNLNGTNDVLGSDSYAGIYVAEGATLTIAGDGSLQATGGNGSDGVINLPNYMILPNLSRGFHTGGAGIGGNGVWLYRDDTWVDGFLPRFGTVIINGGTITATGGAVQGANYGGGAGIGAGGSSSAERDKILPFQGKVEINNGFITANGGNCSYWSETGGGAGIGAGGVTGGWFTPYNNEIQVTINGGIVKATAYADGAGIGGGANAEGGIIRITNGQVTATGGHESSGVYGGAGIGGGDMSGLTSISITGGTVVASGGGAAAGIGSGNDGFVGHVDHDKEEDIYGSITIGGDADVTAHGGQLGGAAIGSGRKGWFSIDCGTITIADQATVRAYAGANAQAIGAGARNDGLEFGELRLEDGITLWAQTQSEGVAPLWERNDQVYNSDTTYLVTKQTDSVADGRLTFPSTTPNATFEYTITDSALQIGGETIAGALPKEPLGNWATLYTVTYDVTYQFVGEVPDGAVLPIIESVASTTAFTPTKPIEVEGWTFDGWYTDETCQTKFVDGTMLTADTLLYGKWKEKTPEVVQYDITYQYVGEVPNGAVLPTVESVASTTAFTPTKPIEVEGWTFDGWYTDETCQAKFMDGTLLTADTILYGTWKKKPTTDPSVPTDTPDTADTNHTTFYDYLLMLSLIGMGAILLADRRQHSSE